ncbi:MAG TPA: GAF domain-containing protein [Anaerolineaceae bacterium]|nr:GAF domain-containing protein [Anaerolineaceae bacterium]
MPVPVSPAQPIPSRRSVRGGLSRTILIILLSVSILPVLFMSGVTYYRARVLMRDQVVSQLQSIVSLQGKQVEDGITARQDALNDLASTGGTKKAIQTVLTQKPGTAEYQTDRGNLSLAMDGLLLNRTQPFFNQIVLLDPNGSVILSTETKWEGQNYGKAAWLKDHLGRDHSAVIFAPTPVYANQLVVITLKTIPVGSSSKTATLVGFSAGNFFHNSLAAADAFNPSARAFFYLSDGQAIGYHPNRTGLTELPISPEQETILNVLKTRTYPTASGEYLGSSQVNYLAYGERLSVVDANLVLEIPSEVVYSQAGSLVPFTIVILAILVITISIVSSISSRQLVEPLNQLAQSTRAFAEGDWTERSPINRSDEIGELAISFNNMADDITHMYRDLETEVNERTHQVRIASEVAQVATSARNLEEILSTTVNLMVERFGYYHASIFLIDSAGEYVVLKEATGVAGEQLKQKGYRLAVGSQSIIGWVASHNQPRLTTNVREDPLYLQDALLEGTRSEVAVPISIGSQILGVLDIQSQELTAFDSDTVSILNTLANQIASAIQNIRLLESTEINLQETSLLYQASRQIAQATEVEEAYKIAVRSLEQTPYGSAVLILENDVFRVFPTVHTPDQSPISFPEMIPVPSLGLDDYLSKNNPTLIRDVYQAPSGLFAMLSIPRKLNHSTAAFIPVRSGADLRAFLLFSSPETGVLTETTIQPYQNLGEMLGSALEKIQALITTGLRVNQLQRLNQISQAVGAETDLSNLYRTLHYQIQEQMGDVYFMVAQYDAKTNLIEFPYIFEGGDTVSVEPYPLGEGLTSILIRSGKPLMLVKDTEEKARSLGAKIQGKPAKSWLGVPLLVGGQPIGAMILQDVEQEERFSEDDLNFITTLAPQISAAIRNAQLLKDTRNALQAFEQERFLLNTLLKNIPDRIYFKDRESRYLRASQSTAVHFGLDDPAAMVGKSDFDILPEEEARLRYLEEQDLIHGGEAQIGLIEKETSPSGVERWVLSTRLPLVDADQQTVGLFGSSRDITELKAAQDVAQRRAQQLRTAAEIARDTSGTLELDELLRKVVNLVRERFNFYHASVFLGDSSGEYVELRESTGEAGRKMKEKGHRLGIGSQSVVGQAAIRGEPLVVNDVAKDPTHLPNPLLPDTRAELAIPLKVADRVIGALDVQSMQKQAFSVEEVSILQVLADQLAIAVVNANLFAETQENLAQHRLLHQITTAAASSNGVDEALASAVQGLRVALGGDKVTIFLLNREQNLLQVKSYAGYEEQSFRTFSVPYGQGIIGWVAANRQPVRIDDTRHDQRYIAATPGIQSELAVPLIYRDELLGVLNLENEKANAYNESDQEILGTLGGSLAAIIANSQLIEQIRRQMDRQRQLFEATSKIRRSVNIQNILETSVTEIGKAIGVRRAKIEIHPTVESDEAASSSAASSNPNGKEKKS